MQRWNMNSNSFIAENYELKVLTKKTSGVETKPQNMKHTAQGETWQDDRWCDKEQRQTEDLNTQDNERMGSRWKHQEQIWLTG